MLKLSFWGWVQNTDFLKSKCLGKLDVKRFKPKGLEYRYKKDNEVIKYEAPGYTPRAGPNFA